MKILEIKNNLVKISYTPEDKLELSGFVIIEDSTSPYVAQVMSLKADSGINYAIVKLLFTFDEEGVVKNYNGTIPSLEADITKLSADELLDILPIDNPFMVGKLAQQDFILNIDYSVFDKNLLICSDNNENTDILLSNIAKRIMENNDKSVVFDSTGTIESDNKLIFGKDFKLPLNYDTINYIYEHDLNDVDPQTKAIIQDVLLEVQEYSKTLLDQFIPFDIFTSVIESQAKALQLPELTLLKSRLVKYKDEQIFAQEAKDFQGLRASVRGNLSTVIDLSAIDSELQNLVISTVYNELTDLGLFMYSLVKINNDNADKRLLKKLITNKKIATTIVAPHNYKYIHDLKELSSNLILFVPLTIQHDFASYNVFLNKLNFNEAVIIGKATQNIPLIIEVLPLEVLQEQQKANGSNSENKSNVEEDVFSEESDTYSQTDMIMDNTPEVPEEQELAEESNEIFEEKIDSNIQEEPEEAPYTLEEELSPEVPENTKYTEETISDNSDLVDGFEEETPDYNNEYNIVMAEEHPHEEESHQNLTEDDLDFIDDLNVSETDDNIITEEESQNETFEYEEEQSSFDYNNNEELNMIEASDNILEEESEENSYFSEEQPPVVPLYPVEEQSPIGGGDIANMFNPGDKVSHSKYGVGIVEKMVKFGDKILCSINFESGRRLLDPTISQLTKE